MGAAQIIAEAENLTSSDRLKLLEKLWEKFASDLERAPIPAEHVRIIQGRLEALKAGQTTPVDWGTARTSILQKYENRDNPGSAG